VPPIGPLRWREPQPPTPWQGVRRADAFAQFEKWGIAGVKIDFMDRADQWMVDWYRTVAQKAAIAHGLRRHVWPLLSAGRVRPVIHATFPLAEASEAHRLMETSQHIGKIVLTMGHP